MGKHKKNLIIVFGFLLVGLGLLWGRPSTQISESINSTDPNVQPTFSVNTNSDATKPTSQEPQTPTESTIVQFANSAAKSEFQRQNNLKSTELLPTAGGAFVVNKPSTELQAVSGTSTYPNQNYHVLLTPNDPRYAQAWHLPKIAAPAAWDISTGTSSTTVAVIDTGFGLNHQDLTTQWAPGGYDFVCNDNSPQAGDNDCDSSPNSNAATHGTMTSGLVGAATNNALGTASVNWNIKVLPLQVLSDSGSGTTSGVASAIDYAVERGAKIISMSLGSTSTDNFLRQRIDAAISAGVTVIAAAGNCGDPNSYVANGCSYAGQILEPAGYAPVIAVGATNSNDARGSFSSYGSALDVMAPGVSVFSTYWSNSSQTSAYGSGSGTSFATPIVASSAALIKSTTPNATPAEIESALITGADKTAGMSGQNKTDNYGYGRINAAHSLSAYSWSLISSNVQASQSDTSNVDTNNLSPGQTAWVKVSAKNTGTATWTNTGSNPVRIGTWAPLDRASNFQPQGGGWLSAVRPAALSENSVAPGETGTFEFPITAGANGGYYSERFNLLAEGITWMNDAQLSLALRVNSNYSYSFDSQYAKDFISNDALTLANLSPGQKFVFGVKVRNTGNTTWYGSGQYVTKLGTARPSDRDSNFYNATWLAPNRVVAVKNVDGSGEVRPGEVGVFEAVYNTPYKPGSIREPLNIVVENVRWLNDIGIGVPGSINGTYSEAFDSQYAKDPNTSVAIDPQHLNPGQKFVFGLRVKNTGNTTWYNSGSFPARLGTANPIDRIDSPLYEGSWLGQTRISAMKEPVVRPGEIGTFEGTYLAPVSGCGYKEYIRPVIENLLWLNDLGAHIPTCVQ